MRSYRVPSRNKGTGPQIGMWVPARAHSEKKVLLQRKTSREGLSRGEWVSATQVR
ncbi:hypothetical protein M9458_017695, partial [Cirrhinus mrigala]